MAFTNAFENPSLFQDLRKNFLQLFMLRSVQVCRCLVKANVYYCLKHTCFQNKRQCIWRIIAQWTISSEKKYLKWLRGETKFKDLEIFISFGSIQQ